MRVLVTGGTGFLGAPLVEALLSRGDEVRVLHRRRSRIDDLSAGVERVEGNVVRRDSLDRAMDGCEIVFHTAALSKPWSRRPELYRKINVEGAANVCRAARRVGARLVFTSCVMALGPTGRRPVDESHSRPTPRYFSDLEQSLAEADQLVREEASQSLDVVTLYCGWLYGHADFSKDNEMLMLAKDFLLRRVPGVPGTGEQFRTYAYVNDLVEGHLSAAEKAGKGARFILGGPVVSLKEVYGALARLTNQRPPRIHMPLILLKQFSRVGEGIGRLTGRAPFMPWGKIETLSRHWAFNSALAEAEIGYRMTPFEEGIEKVLDRLKRHFI